MIFGHKEHFYEKMTPQEFVRFTKRKLKEHRRRVLWGNIRFMMPVMLGLLFYVWQIFDWTKTTSNIDPYTYDGLTEGYLEFLFLFLAFPLFVIVKIAELLGYIDKDRHNQNRYEVAIFYWVVYSIVTLISLINLFKWFS